MGGVVSKLIERNTTIPFKKSQVYSTASDNQPAVSIHILQGEREMARDNKSLGTFDLSGIAPAPRGVPQIEVTFDIDANGVLSVTAKDKGTGKSQSITISGSSGLDKSEVERMVNEAEAHREEDRIKREAVDVKNNAESLLFTTRKSLNEHRDKLSVTDVEQIEAAMQKFEVVIQAGDPEAIKSETEAFMKSAQKIGEILYAQHQAEGAEGAKDSDNKDETVVDAEFEKMDDHK